MSAMSPEVQQRIYDLRTRITKNEPVSADELREAIMALRQTRVARAKQQADDAAAKPKRRKASSAANAGPVPVSLDDVNALFSKKKEA